MYAFGAMLSFTIAHVSVIRLRITQPDRSAPVPRAGDAALARLRAAAVRDRRRGSAPCSRSSSSRSCTSTWRSRACAGWRSASSLYIVYRHSQGLDLTTTTKVAIPQPVIEHEAEYESVLVALDVRAVLRGRGRDRGQGRRAPAPRHPRARHDPRPGVVADRRRDARAGARRAGDHRAGAAAGRPAGDRPLREGPRRARRAA